VDHVGAMRHIRGHRRHLDADQIVGDDLHVVLLDRPADEILLCRGAACDRDQASGRQHG